MITLSSRALAILFIIIILYMLVFSRNVDSGIFLHLNSFFLVIFGTFASSLLSFNVAKVLKSFAFISQSLFKEANNEQKVEEFETLVQIAHEIKNTNGFGCIDNILETQKLSPFVRYGLELLSSGYSEIKLQEMLDNFADESDFQQKQFEDIMQNMANSAPAFGMIGTIMGLIIMLTNLNSELNNIGEGLAFALITTLYGVVFSNVIFRPAAVYIEEQRKHERHQIGALSLGVIQLRRRVDPLILQDYLNSHLSIKDQIKIEQA